MPWTVGDVDEHKKGLTPAQKKKWVSVANGVLKDCQSKGGKDCEGKAIRIANSKFEEKQMSLKTEKIPKGALRFVGEGCHAFAELSTEDEKPPKLKMTAYNGKVIKGHWYWDDLAIDLSGMSFPGGKFPILENHNTDRKVGFHKGKPSTEDNKLELLSEKTQFVSTPAAEEFIKLSSEGFPYQASIYAKPTEIQRLTKDETTEVNGFTMRGPGTVWRKSQFKEASVCVFGWDSQTSASAFSKTETEDVDFLEETLEENTEQDQFTEGGEIMNLEELKQKHPDLVTQLTEEVTDKVTNELTIIFGEEKKLLEDENARLSGEVDARDERLSKLEKKDALRDEKDRKETADKIWANKLADSEVDEHMWPKVQNMVSYKKFVKDEELDVEAFSAAVDTEIKDWEGRLSTMSNTSGMGFVNRSAEGGGNESKDQLKEENTGLTNSLLKRAGQKVE